MSDLPSEGCHLQPSDAPSAATYPGTLIAYPKISNVRPGEVQTIRGQIAVGFWDRVYATVRARL